MPMTGVIRYYTHSSQNCGFVNVYRTKFIKCDLAPGCTAGELFPAETFSPTCSGTSNLITVNAWAGEYSNINVIANQAYTFTSSVATDFITISNTDGSVIYGRGVTPFTWTSSAAEVIRFYIHADGNCGTQDVDRVRRMSCETFCGLPGSVAAVNISPTSATLTWSAPAIAPQNYHIYYSTTNTPPERFQLHPGDERFVNQHHGIECKYDLLFLGAFELLSGKECLVPGTFTTLPVLNCNSATYGVYPSWTFTPSCTGSKETIITNAYASEFTNVNIAANKQFRFESSVSTDYITITNELGSVVYASGTTPLLWSSGNISGNIRYYLHTNGACGSQAVDRIKYITCATAGSCGAPSQVGISQISSESVNLTWAAPATGLANAYEIYISPVATAPGNSLPASNYMTTENTYNYTGLQPNQFYYYWMRTYCANGTSGWQLYGSFTTNSPGCIGGTVLFPPDTIVPVCNGNATLITDTGPSW
ncbi:fibronectin type III domain-containing protein [Flavobacterium sp. 3HN19-14]|uniref:fibronectin type III domain-containing protein n=1 Tax=Flavobacterium sp. 3HN19-14 TaxID=3448133 RepID=UPI003EE20424